MKTTLELRYVGQEGDTHPDTQVVVEYDGRVEFKFDHVWLNAPDRFVCIGTWEDDLDRWEMRNAGGTVIDMFTDVIVVGVET